MSQTHYFYMPKVISTPRLELRILEATLENGKKVADFVCENQNHFKQYLSRFANATTPTKALDIIEDTYDCFCEAPKWNYLVFKEDAIIGFIGMVEYDSTREIQYGIAEKHQGKGYVREALVALEKEAFNGNKKTLRLEIKNANRQSLKVARAMGFEKQCDWGDFWDVHRYRSSWLKTFEVFSAQQAKPERIRSWRDESLPMAQNAYTREN